MDQDNTNTDSLDSSDDQEELLSPPQRLAGRPKGTGRLEKVAKHRRGRPPKHKDDFETHRPKSSGQGGLPRIRELHMLQSYQRMRKMQRPRNASLGGLERRRVLHLYCRLTKRSKSKTKINCFENVCDGVSHRDMALSTPASHRQRWSLDRPTRKKRQFHAGVAEEGRARQSIASRGRPCMTMSVLILSQMMTSKHRDIQASLLVDPEVLKTVKTTRALEVLVTRLTTTQTWHQMNVNQIPPTPLFIACQRWRLLVLFQDGPSLRQPEVGLEKVVIVYCCLLTKAWVQSIDGAGHLKPRPAQIARPNFQGR